MRTITTIGIDLAKSAFSTCTVDASGRVLQRQDLRREAFSMWLAHVPAGTTVAMEACSSAHHWGRRCREHGLEPRLMAAQFVKPFRKSQSTKNDRNDAEAIATAARQGNMRFVPVKTIDQQARLSEHRIREGYKTDALSASNRLRGILAEFGVVVARSDAALRRVLAGLDALPIPASTRLALHGLQQHWAASRDLEATCSRRILAYAREDARCRRLQQIIGIGPLTADALVASIGNARDFKNGRQLAAWLGLAAAVGAEVRSVRSMTRATSSSEVAPSTTRRKPSSASTRKPLAMAAARSSRCVARRTTRSSRSASMRRISMIAMRPR